MYAFVCICACLCCDVCVCVFMCVVCVRSGQFAPVHVNMSSSEMCDGRPAPNLCTLPDSVIVSRPSGVTQDKYNAFSTKIYTALGNTNSYIYI